ncbi:hypothetical protein PoHVEF18_004414 [Penicillium ochrochloron]
MIEPRDRFFSEGQCYFGPSENPRPKLIATSGIGTDYGWSESKGTAKLFLPDEDIEIQILARFADYLSPEVRAITVDDNGLSDGVSTDPEEDDTLFIAYLPFSNIDSLVNSCTIQCSKLQELDRHGPGVDLSTYNDELGVPQKIVFKFTPPEKPQRVQMAWDELNLLKSIPPHPNIVHFDRVVLEDVKSRVIGFTTKYISGGTLDKINLPSRFEWLKQLTQLVDFLNLELGIMHQDIAPRNLLIDLDTHKIRLFGFDWAACGKKRLLDGRDDVAGVVFTIYELITNDRPFAGIPHRDRNIHTVQSLSEWTCNRELDSEVSTFGNF